MISFPPGGIAFAVAGALAALAPVVIHLLHRRKYRVVSWGAMEFLREAVASQRRMLQLRDMLLLALRSSCLLLIGLGLSRAQCTPNAAAVAAGGPIHAVLLIDNSLSMTYQRVDGTLLDEARQRARALVDRLPAESLISVIPYGSDPADYSADPYRTKDDALAALDLVAPVDRVASVNLMLEAATRACRRGVELPGKRIVLFSDVQAVNWPADASWQEQQSLGDLQLVSLAPEHSDNAWVADVRVQDGVADIETATEFVAVIRYEGANPRRNVQVTLAVDGTPVESQTVDLEPGQRRDVTFTHRFDVSVEAGQASYVSATVELAPDRLAGDDARSLAVPVVAGLPVVFVDNLGDQEDPAQGRFGETYRLRRLLAPGSKRDAARHAVRIRHVRIEEVDRELLEDARLVVIAGVESPGVATKLLREYVEQGGPLLLAAGADFDVSAWSAQAWLDGAGILPLPLKPELTGHRPIDAGVPLSPFRLSATSLEHPYFAIEDASAEELADLYREPLFFQAITVNEQPTAAPKKEAASADEAPTRWLLWAPPGLAAREDSKPDSPPEKPSVHVLARFDSGLPFLIERHIGRGQVLLVTTSVQSDWNTLTTCNAVLLFDRIMRHLLANTLPKHDFAAGEPIVLPVTPTQRSWQFQLYDTLGNEDTLAVEALGPQSYGIVLRGILQRGLYKVVGLRDANDTATDWQYPLAVQGPDRESELKPLTAADLPQRLAGMTAHVVAPDEEINVTSTGQPGTALWSWLLGLVMVAMVAELGVLAWPNRNREASP